MAWCPASTRSLPSIGPIRPHSSAIRPSLEPASEPDGPGELLFDSNGNRLAKLLADGKPNFTAPDGVSMTPDLTGFQPFYYGTSAAALDAAAVAALMLQANPNLTPTQVTADLEASAVSLGLVRRPARAALRAGRRSAVKLALAPVLPSVPDPLQASDSGVSHTDNITNVTTPTFNGKDDAGSTITLFDGVQPSSAPPRRMHRAVGRSRRRARALRRRARDQGTGERRRRGYQRVHPAPGLQSPSTPPHPRCRVPDLAAASDSRHVEHRQRHQRDDADIQRQGAMPARR